MVNKKGNKKRGFGEIVFIIIVTILFVSPAIIVGESLDLRITSFILFFVMGWGVANEILEYFSGREKSHKNILLNNLAIVIYITIYITLFIIINIELFRTNFLVALFLSEFFSYALFYSGLRAVIYRRAKVWNGKLTGKGAIINGVFRLIASTILLFFVPLLKMI